MQTMNLFQPVMGNSAGLNLNADKGSKGEMNGLFQSILEANGMESAENGLVLPQAETESDHASLLEDIFGKEFVEKLLQQIEDGVSLEDILGQMDMDAEKELIEMNPESKVGLNSALLDVLKKNLQSIKDSSAIDISEVTIQQLTVAVNETDTDGLKIEMQQTLKEISELLLTFKDDGKLNRADASKLTNLFKQWSSLLRQAKDTELNASKLQNQVLDNEDSELLDKLLQRYEKRAYFSGKNMYSQNAGVSRQDVMGWLQQAVENQGPTDVKPVHFIAQDQQMTRVEQHVIHLENAGKVERVGSELISKFASAIQDSQLLSKGAGKMELNLILRPDHLGPITVKMAKVDGEMMVKLLVSTQASKDLLEQNMHQLRHLFSPHQVSVERNEAVTDDEFFQDDQEEQGQEEQTDEQHEEEHKREDKRPKIDFETIFNQVNEEEKE